MILESWEICGIIAGVILIILVPLLLWLRYSKQGREYFSLNKQDLEEANQELELKLKIINEKNNQINKSNLLNYFRKKIFFYQLKLIRKKLKKNSDMLDKNYKKN